jgi:hypothetical protein
MTGPSRRPPCGAAITRPITTCVSISPPSSMLTTSPSVARPS